MLPTTPCPFPQEFLADVPSDREVLSSDELSELDPAKTPVRCRLPTDVPLPLTTSQRAHPLRHPSHVAGAVMVHASGMLGFVHAYYVLGLRHREGWVGYGTHIHRVVFRKLVPPGAPIDATCIATKIRKGSTRYLVRYSFAFRHEGDLCYEGDQTAVWMDVHRDKASAAPSID